MTVTAATVQVTERHVRFEGSVKTTAGATGRIAGRCTLVPLQIEASFHCPSLDVAPLAALVVDTPVTGRALVEGALTASPTGPAGSWHVLPEGTIELQDVTMAPWLQGLFAKARLTRERFHLVHARARVDVPTIGSVTAAAEVSATSSTVDVTRFEGTTASGMRAVVSGPLTADTTTPWACLRAVAAGAARPRLTARVENLRHVAEGFAVRDGSLEASLTSSRLTATLSRATMTVTTLPPFTVAGTATGTTTSFGFDDLRFDGGSAGRASVSLRTTLPSTTSVTAALRRLAFEPSLPLTADVTVTAFDTSSVAGRCSVPAELGGTVDGTMSVTGRVQAGTLADLRLSGRLVARQVTCPVGPAVVSDLAGILTMTESSADLSVDDGRLDLAGLPVLRTRGRIRWDRTAGLTVTDLRLTGPRGLAGAFTLTIPPGEAWPSRLHCAVDSLYVGPHRLLAPSVGGIPLVGSLSCRMHIERRSGTASLAFAAAPDAPLAVTATAAVTQTVDMGAAVFDVRLPGGTTVARLDARVPRAGPAVAAVTLTSAPLEVLGLPVSTTSAKGRVTWTAAATAFPFSALVAQLPAEARLHLASLSTGGTVELVRPTEMALSPSNRSANGRFTLRLLQHAMDVQVDVRDGVPRVHVMGGPYSLTELWRLFRPDDIFLKPIGTVRADVTLPAPYGGTLSFDGFGGEHWQKHDGLIRRLQVTVPATTVTLGGDGAFPTLSSDACSYDGRALTLRALPIAWSETAPLEGRLLRQGKVTVTADVVGTTGSGSVEGWSDRLRPDGTMGRMTIAATFARTTMGEEQASFALSAPNGGSGTGEGTADGRRLRASLTATALPLAHVPGYAAFDASRVDADVRLAMAMPGGLVAQVGRFRDEGLPALAGLLRRDGALDVRRFAIDGPSLALATERPFKARFTGSGVELDGFSAHVAGHRLSASGIFDPYGTCRLTLGSDGVPLTAIAVMAGLPQLEPTGELTATLTLTGTMPLPDLEGSLAVTNGSLQVPPFAERLGLPSLNLRSQGSTTVVSAAGTTWGGVPLILQGRQDPSGTTFTLAGTNLAATVGTTNLPGLALDLQAVVPLQGPLRIRGTLTGRRDATVTLPSRPPTLATSDDGSLQRALVLLGRTDTIIEAALPSRLRLVNAFLDAEVRGSARLASLPEPSLSVRLELIRGEVTIHRRIFTLQQGSFTASGRPDGPRTMLSLQARTVMTDYTINLAVTGSLDDPQVNLTSTPPLPEEAIIQLLTTGVIPLSTDPSQMGRDVRTELTATARDYLVTSALGDFLRSRLGLRGVTVRSTDEGSYLRMRQYVGRRLAVNVDQALSQRAPVDGGGTTVSFEWGLSKALLLQGRTTDGEQGGQSGSYLGLLRTIRFR